MDRRFLLEQGTGLFTGNELIAKGALESGAALITGYPGSPVSEVFEALEGIRELLVEQGIVAQIANNEALAAARLNGAQMDEIRAMAIMKSVGMHVAADGLALGNMAGAHPRAGALVVVGDDTWSEGTQVPADSRFLSQHLYMPVLEPATFQEIKDWVGLGFELSRLSRLFVTYLVTSNQADGGGSVEVRPNQYPAVSARRRVRLDPRSIACHERVIIPPDTARKEQEVVHDRLPRLLALARSRPVNRLLHPAATPRPLGFIVSGLAYTYLEHALHLLGLTGSFPILKLGLTYPVDPEAVAALAEQADHLCVVEEKRPFVETQVAAALTQLQQAGRCRPVRLWGKRFPGGEPGFPDTVGLHPSLVVQHLARLFAALDCRELPLDPARLEQQLRRARTHLQEGLAVPVRTPAFCPGCPHRDSASVLDRIAADFGDPGFMAGRGCGTQDLVFHGDIGCYSMLKYPPFDRLMHNLSGMGLGGGTGAGIDPFVDNKQVVFMGDSTFFHTGAIAISDSIKHGQDITYVILENKTTAMTGHQPTPGVEVDLLGQATPAQDIERIVRGLARGSDTLVARADPSRRQAYRRLLEQAVLRPGVKVVIADKECGITFHRRRRAARAAAAAAQGYLPVEEHINISEEACEYCLECARGTGCSGLTVRATPYGPKMAIDLSSCVTDGACTKVEVPGGDRTCPSFERVTVRRRQAPVVALPEVEVGQLPNPEPRPLTQIWHAYVAGVGGMGINVVASVLAQAGMRQGHAVRLTNKKGLAVRNGSVYSHLSFAPPGLVISPMIPWGQADLLLGLDVLEAARGVDPRGRHRIASPESTTALLNTAKTPTVSTLTGEEDFSPAELSTLIGHHTRPGGLVALDLFLISETYLGNKLYANVMMLGMAFQLGLLPLELETLEAALGAAVRRDLATNAKAFAMGRRLAIDPDHFPVGEPPETLAALRDRLEGYLRRGRGGATAAWYRRRADEALARLELDERTREHLVRRLHDLVQYEGTAYAEEYLERVERVHRRDSAAHAWQATRAVVHGLADAMVIKDEVYVAHLLTCEEKYERDRRRYRVDPSRGDRLVYRHLTRPHLRLFGRDVRPDLEVGDGLLRILARGRFLRRWLASWWHVEERGFRDWYAGLVDRFAHRDAAEYRTWVELLRLPEQVRGYRAVRAPRMAAARRRAEELLARRPAADSTGRTEIEPVPARQRQPAGA